ncbi:hypothetical protein BVJ53_09725 [Lacticaseibacillus chiayiensis]|jgi:hypothetical protein|uniref:Uncharacterized protein n=1 Tax=Lacticaseibacillus chiayiensis TaxID=2100821 RepID=A0A4Q1TQ23_9LACO|nr:hypothetical protein BVJ53_09725 [Lacticaseibacillus chiayiensis]RXT57935.1 hypothetical protein CHT97_09355 [Lacticaseibacillus chiayiensis]
MNMTKTLLLVIFVLVYLLGVLVYTLSKKNGHYRVWNDKYLDSDNEISFIRAYVLNAIWFITYA